MFSLYMSLENFISRLYWTFQCLLESFENWNTFLCFEGEFCVFFVYFVILFF